MQEELGEEVEFLVVYIREAHALDGRMPMGGGGAPLVEEPLTIGERKAIAHRCAGAVDMAPMTMLVDGMDDSTCAKYAAWPDRLYLVGRDGRVAFAGGRGPGGFKPELLEAAIVTELEAPSGRAPR